MSGDNFLMERLASHGLDLTLDELRECLRLSDKVFRNDPFTPGEVVWCLGTLSRVEPAASSPSTEGRA